jgi:hypothetical protein
MKTFTGCYVSRVSGCQDRQIQSRRLAEMSADRLLLLCASRML